MVFEKIYLIKSEENLSVKPEYNCKIDICCMSTDFKSIEMQLIRNWSIPYIV